MQEIKKEQCFSNVSSNSLMLNLHGAKSNWNNYTVTVLYNICLRNCDDLNTRHAAIEEEGIFIRLFIFQTNIFRINMEKCTKKQLEKRTMIVVNSEWQKQPSVLHCQALTVYLHLLAFEDQYSKFMYTRREVTNIDTIESKNYFQPHKRLGYTLLPPS